MNPLALAFLLLATLAGNAMAQSGEKLIEESLKKYALPSHTYEEQALVITDHQGKMTIRTIRSYSVCDESGSKNLRVIETPADARGTAIYLAHARGGARLGLATSSPAFGSNFTLADLEVEQSGDFRYEYEGKQFVDRVPHYVVRAMPADDSVTRRTGYYERRLYLRKDNLFISRIDYQNRDGRQTRRQTFRDPAPDDSGTWRARMILMENLRDGERSLLKIERRVHSSDYVPAKVFAGLRTIP